MEKTLYRTVIEIEVISSEPIPDALDVEEIMREAYDGDYSARKTLKTENEPIKGKEAVQYVKNQGSDPEVFFFMDEDGNDIWDEENEE